MPVTLPFDLTTPAQREIKSSELMANYQSLADKFSAGIVDADVSASANISGAKLALNSLPANRIANNGITQAQMATNSIGTAQIIDGNVTPAKIPVASIAKDRLKVQEVTQAFSTALGGALAFVITVSPSAALPAMGAMFPISLTVEGVNANTEAIASLRDAAGVTVYSLLVYNSVGTNPKTGTIRFRYIALT